MSYRPTLLEMALCRLRGLVGPCHVGLTICVAMVLVGFFMNFFGMFQIVQPFTLNHWFAVYKSGFHESSDNSLMLGFGVASSAVVIYAFLGYVILRTRLPGRPLLNLLVWIPWAIPGFLSVSRCWLFLKVPLLHFFYGTIFILIFALILKDMPIGTQMIKAAFSQVSLDLDQASRVVGPDLLHLFAE